MSETTLALDVLESVGPAGNFLGQKHTRENLMKEQWFPTLSNRLSYHAPKKDGLDLWKRARNEAIEILKTHKPEPLDNEKRERMRIIVREAERRTT